MDDWAPGDLALCVGANDEDCSHPLDKTAIDDGFVIGCVYIVDDVFRIFGDVGLYFSGKPSGGPWDAWSALCFRKVPPLTDEEREDFAEDLRIPDHDRLVEG